MGMYKKFCPPYLDGTFGVMAIVIACIIVLIVVSVCVLICCSIISDQRLKQWKFHKKMYAKAQKHQQKQQQAHGLGMVEARPPPLPPYFVNAVPQQTLPFGSCASAEAVTPYPQHFNAELPPPPYPNQQASGFVFFC